MQIRKITLMLIVVGMMSLNTAFGQNDCERVIDYSGTAYIHRMFFPVGEGRVTVDFAALNVVDTLILRSGGQTLLIVPMGTQRQTVLPDPLYIENWTREQYDPSRHGSSQLSQHDGFGRFVVDVQGCGLEVIVKSNATAETIWYLWVSCCPDCIPPPVTYVTKDTSVCLGTYINGNEVLQDTSFRFVDLTQDGCDSITTLQVNVFESVLYDTVQYCATVDETVYTEQVDTTIGLCQAVVMRTYVPAPMPTLDLRVESECGVSYLITPTEMRTLFQSGYEFVRSENDFGCSIDSTVWVEVHPDTLEDQQIALRVLKGQILSDVYNGRYLDWTNERGELFDTIQQIVSDTRIVGTIVDSFSCDARIEIILDIDPGGFDMPTAFSPNGDGVNDFFQVFGDDVSTVDDVQVFNRWGNLVYQDKRDDGAYSSGVNLWDGTFQDKICNPDVYVVLVTVTFKGGEQVMLAQDLTLIR